MTPEEWLACHDPALLLPFLREKVSRRKLRLFAVACLRSIWPQLSDVERRAAEVAERHADGAATDNDLVSAYADVYLLDKPDAEDAEDEGDAYLNDVFADALTTAGYARSRAGDSAADQAGLLRDIAGDPFRPVAVPAAWRTPRVLGLARGIYEAGAFERLPVLAKALESAGCVNAELLDHLRGSGPHVRGCWALDLILAKD